MVIKGSAQTRKRWESSALLLSVSKVCRGMVVEAEVAHPSWREHSGRATLERRARMLGCAGVCCWPSQRRRRGAGWDTHCEARAARDHVPAWALRAAQHPAGALWEIPLITRPPGSYRRGSWGSRSQPKSEMCGGEHEPGMHSWLPQPSGWVASRWCLPGCPLFSLWHFCASPRGSAAHSCCARPSPWLRSGS